APVQKLYAPVQVIPGKLVPVQDFHSKPNENVHMRPHLHLDPWRLVLLFL
ncbi:hypothetical protein A2U01_0070581, partial [Trifolium medium]|nr:hypothetical protein [Trifolium medium]